jgi:hypothetical protein
MGRKLTADELTRVDTIIKLLVQIPPKWGDMKGGWSYWAEVHSRLRDMRRHGTVDGKPEEFEWVEPTDEDAKQRPEVEVKDFCDSEWQKKTLVFVGETYWTISATGCEPLEWDECRMKKVKQ